MMYIVGARRKQSMDAGVATWYAGMGSVRGPKSDRKAVINVNMFKMRVNSMSAQVGVGVDVVMSGVVGKITSSEDIVEVLGRRKLDGIGNNVNQNAYERHAGF
jgi:hypothetical protein